MSATQTYTGELAVIECCQCRMAFGVPTLYQRDRRTDHGTFYCPVGHGNHYPGGLSTEQQLKKATREARELTEQLAAARSLATRERERRESADRRRAAAQGQVTKIKRRMAHGVCPCCNRTFADVARHMAGQHPDFLASVTP